MSTLEPREKSKLEQLLHMSSGYVLGYSDASFGEFFGGLVDIDIHSAKYQRHGTSKAKKLREFWNVEPDPLVGKVMHGLIDYAEGIRGNEVPELIAECRAIADRLLGTRPNLAPLRKVAERFDAHYLARQIKRMSDAVDNDPDLAIGTAKELIETCCKTILAERGKPVEGSPEIAQLTKNTLRELNLVPEGVSDATRGADVVRRLLQQLGSIGNNLAELRGLYGTGHGKHGKASGLKARHAKLAVGASATFATFLFETHLESKS